MTEWALISPVIGRSTWLVGSVSLGGFKSTIVQSLEAGIGKACGAT